MDLNHQRVMLITRSRSVPEAIDSAVNICLNYVNYITKFVEGDRL
jgi:hypothetical protein